jgi:formylmethanofuran dehydrogenase subunit E
MSSPRLSLASLFALGLLACAHAPPLHPKGQTQPEPAAQSDNPDADEATLAAVRSIHGEASPWVVAGYRMGVYALTRLKLPRGHADLEVIHYSPHEVQYASIADGASAATGATLGHLNLRLEEVDQDQTRTTYRNRVSGSAITLQATPEFSARYTNVAAPQLAAAGRDALHLADAVIFKEVTATSP